MNDKVLLGGKVLLISILTLFVTLLPALFETTLKVAWNLFLISGIWRGVAAVAVFNLVESIQKRRRARAFRKLYHIDPSDWRIWTKDEEGEDLEF